MGVNCGSVPVQCYRSARLSSRFLKEVCSKCSSTSFHGLLLMPEGLNVSEKKYSHHCLTRQTGQRHCPEHHCQHHLCEAVCRSATKSTPPLLHSIKKIIPFLPTSQWGMMQTSCTHIRAKCFPKSAISLEADRQTDSPLFQRHGVHAHLDYKTSAHMRCRFPPGTHCSCNPAMQYRRSSTLASPLQNT